MQFCSNRIEFVINCREGKWARYEFNREKITDDIVQSFIRRNKKN